MVNRSTAVVVRKPQQEGFPAFAEAQLVQRGSLAPAPRPEPLHVPAPSARNPASLLVRVAAFLSLVGLCVGLSVFRVSLVDANSPASNEDDAGWTRYDYIGVGVYSTLSLVAALAVASIHERRRRLGRQINEYYRRQRDLQRRAFLLRMYRWSLRKQLARVRQRQVRIARKFDSYLVRARKQDEREHRAAVKHQRRVRGKLADAALSWALWLRVRQSITGFFGRLGSRFSSKKRSRDTRIVSSLVLFALVGLGTGCEDLINTAEPLEVVAVCDRSSSAGETSCSISDLETIYRGYVDQSHLRRGSRLSILVPGQGIDDPQWVFESSPPQQWQRGGVPQQKRSWELDESERLSTVGLPVLDNASGLFESQWTGAGRLQARPDSRRILVIASDLRQVSGSHNFERRVPQPERFLAWLEDEQLVADLTGIEVVVCGKHDRSITGPTWTAQKSQSVQDVWEHALSAMNPLSLSFEQDCHLPSAPIASEDLGGETP